MNAREKLPSAARRPALALLLWASHLGLVATVYLTAVDAWGPVLSLACALLSVPASQLLIGVASFLVKMGLGDWPSRQRGPWRRSLAVIWNESFWMLRLYSVDQCWPWSLQRLPAEYPMGPPVVLVHGFFCNAGVWRALLLRCRRPAVAISLEPTYRHFEGQLRALDAAVDTVLRHSGQPGVILVGHSMGGLLARAYAHQFPDRVAGYVSVAAPHAGTMLGALVYGREYGPPSPQARWLQRFNAETVGKVRGVHFHTLDDNIVIPAVHSICPTGDNRRLEGGHLAAICEPGSVDQILRVVDQLATDAVAAT